MNDVSIINKHREVQHVAANMGLKVVLLGHGEGIRVERNDTSERLFNSQSIYEIYAYLRGLEDRIPARDEDSYIETIESLKEKAAKLIRSINGAWPRPHVDDAINELEKLL